MTDTILICDQAIFTSLRSKMGEGYRIVAAGRGVSADEKQAITRYSPSHDALCGLTSAAAQRPGRLGARKVAGVVSGRPTSGGIGQSACAVAGSRPDASSECVSGSGALAFYSLPSGRLCVAFSCSAGAEHTGRGGQRIYTLNLILEPADFQRCGFNPFHIYRAMAAARLTDPQLAPPPVLPELRLCLPSGVDSGSVGFDGAIGSSCRRRVLVRLLAEGSVIVNADGPGLDSAEAWLLGVPGPMRSRLSFAVGLNFSVSRRHRFHVLRIDGAAIKPRLGAGAADYIELTGVETDKASDSAWISFVERHWDRGEMAVLARRTSRAFADGSAATRERVAGLYHRIDEVPSTGPNALLALAREHIPDRGPEAERDIVAELLCGIQRELPKRLADLTSEESRRCWPALAEFGRSNENAAAFVRPIVESTLTRAMNINPVEAAKASLVFARGVAARSFSGILDQVLVRLADWTAKADAAALQPLDELCHQWAAVLPGNPSVSRIRERLSATNARD